MNLPLGSLSCCQSGATGCQGCLLVQYVVHWKELSAHLFDREPMSGLLWFSESLAQAQAKPS